MASPAPTPEAIRAYRREHNVSSEEAEATLREEAEYAALRAWANEAAKRGATRGAVEPARPASPAQAAPADDTDPDADDYERLKAWAREKTKPVLPATGREQVAMGVSPRLPSPGSPAELEAGYRAKYIAGQRAAGFGEGAGQRAEEELAAMRRSRPEKTAIADMSLGAAASLARWEAVEAGVAPESLPARALEGLGKKEYGKGANVPVRTVRRRPVKPMAIQDRRSVIASTLITEGVAPEEAKRRAIIIAAADPDSGRIEPGSETTASSFTGMRPVEAAPPTAGRVSSDLARGLWNLPGEAVGLAKDLADLGPAIGEAAARKGMEWGLPGASLGAPIAHFMREPSDFIDPLGEETLWTMAAKSASDSASPAVRAIGEAMASSAERDAGLSAAFVGSFGAAARSLGGDESLAYRVATGVLSEMEPEHELELKSGVRIAAETPNALLTAGTQLGAAAMALPGRWGDVLSGELAPSEAVIQGLGGLGAAGMTAATPVLDALTTLSFYTDNGRQRESGAGHALRVWGTVFGGLVTTWLGRVSDKVLTDVYGAQSYRRQRAPDDTPLTWWNSVLAPLSSDYWHDYATSLWRGDALATETMMALDTVALGMPDIDPETRASLRQGGGLWGAAVTSAMFGDLFFGLDRAPIAAVKGTLLRTNALTAAATATSRLGAPADVRREMLTAAVVPSWGQRGRMADPDYALGLEIGERSILEAASWLTRLAPPSQRMSQADVQRLADTDPLALVTRYREASGRRDPWIDPVSVVSAIAYREAKRQARNGVVISDPAVHALHPGMARALAEAQSTLAIVPQELERSIRDNATSERLHNMPVTARTAERLRALGWADSEIGSLTEALALEAVLEQRPPTTARGAAPPPEVPPARQPILEAASSYLVVAAAERRRPLGALPEDVAAIPDVKARTSAAMTRLAAHLGVPDGSMALLTALQAALSFMDAKSGRYRRARPPLNLDAFTPAHLDTAIRKLLSASPEQIWRNVVQFERGRPVRWVDDVRGEARSALAGRVPQRAGDRRVAELAREMGLVGVAERVRGPRAEHGPPTAWQSVVRGAMTLLRGPADQVNAARGKLRAAEDRAFRVLATVAERFPHVDVTVPEGSTVAAVLAARVAQVEALDAALAARMREAADALTRARARVDGTGRLFEVAATWVERLLEAAEPARRSAAEPVSARQQVRDTLAGLVAASLVTFRAEDIDLYLAVMDRVAEGLARQGILAKPGDLWNHLLFQEALGGVLTSPAQSARIDIAGALSAAQAIVHLGRTADLSTLFHENAHLLRALVPDVAMAEVDAFVRTRHGFIDQATGKWTVDAEEWFARQFEGYLREGRVRVSPRDGVVGAIRALLNRVFRAVADTLHRIYSDEQAAVLLGEVHPTTRALFDGWLAVRSKGDDRPLPLSTRPEDATPVRAPEPEPPVARPELPKEEGDARVAAARTAADEEGARQVGRRATLLRRAPGFVEAMERVLRGEEPVVVAPPDPTNPRAVVARVPDPEPPPPPKAPEPPTEPPPAPRAEERPPVPQEPADPLYDRAVEFARRKGEVSVSMIQKEFGVGFNRAEEIVGRMSDEGLLAPPRDPATAYGPRAVLDVPAKAPEPSPTRGPVTAAIEESAAARPAVVPVERPRPASEAPAPARPTRTKVWTREVVAWAGAELARIEKIADRTAQNAALRVWIRTLIRDVLGFDGGDTKALRRQRYAAIGAGGIAEARRYLEWGRGKAERAEAGRVAAPPAPRPAEPSAAPPAPAPPRAPEPDSRALALGTASNRLKAAIEKEKWDTRAVQKALTVLFTVVEQVRTPGAPVPSARMEALRTLIRNLDKKAPGPTRWGIIERTLDGLMADTIAAPLRAPEPEPAPPPRPAPVEPARPADAPEPDVVLAPAPPIPPDAMPVRPLGGGGTAWLTPTGEPHRVVTRNVAADVHYEVVPVRDLLTSHGDDLQPTPGYDQRLQNRQDASRRREWIEGVMKRLDVRQLDPGGVEVTSGPPTVWRDASGRLVVLAGNGRTIALRVLLGGDSAGAQAYRQSVGQWSAAMGIRVDDPQAAVLVRVAHIDPSDAETAIRLAQASQDSTSVSLEPTARIIGETVARRSMMAEPLTLAIDREHGLPNQHATGGDSGVWSQAYAESLVQRYPTINRIVDLIIDDPLQRQALRDARNAHDFVRAVRSAVLTCLPESALTALQRAPQAMQEQVLNAGPAILRLAGLAASRADAAHADIRAILADALALATEAVAAGEATPPAVIERGAKRWDQVAMFDVAEVPPVTRLSVALAVELAGAMSDRAKGGEFASALHRLANELDAGDQVRMFGAPRPDAATLMVDHFVPAEQRERLVKSKLPLDRETALDRAADLRLHAANRATETAARPVEEGAGAGERRTLFQDREEVIEGRVGADMERIYELLGATMYEKPIGEVTIKELVQNAFDAVKAEVGAGRIPIGDIRVTADQTARTITVTDNGAGMTPEIVQKALFTIAGTDKGTLAPGQRSGGLGLAKMAFLFGSDWIEVSTVRNGVETFVRATSPELRRGGFRIVVRPSEAANGTTVTVRLPETYVTRGGESARIYMPYAEYTAFLKEPMIGPARLTVVDVKAPGRVDAPVVRQAAPPDPLFTTVRFDWGEADVYIGTARADHPRHRVLSAGLYQFDTIIKMGSERFPYNVTMDVRPHMGPTMTLADGNVVSNPSYPFNNQREGFRGTVRADIEALSAYLGGHGRGLEARAVAAVFATAVPMERVDQAGLRGSLAAARRAILAAFTRAEDSAATVRQAPAAAAPPSEIRIHKGVADAPVGPVRSERKVAASMRADRAGASVDEVRDTMAVDPRRPLFHNNTNTDLVSHARAEGGEPEAFLSELGSLVVSFRERVAKAGGYGYEVLDEPGVVYASGISVDKRYKGVHVRVPYRAFFLNPFAHPSVSPIGAAEGMLHTLLHEAVHTKVGNHNEAFTIEFGRLWEAFADTADTHAFRMELEKILGGYWDTFTTMREKYDDFRTANVARSLEGESDVAAGAARGHADDAGGRGGPAGAGGGGRVGADVVPPDAGGVQRGVDSARDVIESRLRTDAAETGGRILYQDREADVRTRSDPEFMGDEWIANFRRWFGRSKVAESDGGVRQVYHGTSSGGFEAFDPVRTDPNALYGRGFYFTEDPGVAGGYARDTGARPGAVPGGGGIIPAYLRIERPFDVDAKFDPEASRRVIDAAIATVRDPAARGSFRAPETTVSGEHLLAEVGMGFNREAARRARLADTRPGALAEPVPFQQVLRAAGYDGITHIGGSRTGTEPHRVWIAWEPTQIKSPFNRGTFDANDARILFQDRELIRGLRETVESARTAADWKDWYARNDAVLDAVVGPHRDLFRRFLAATSQRNTVGGNVSAAIKALGQHLRGEPFAGFITPVIRNLERIVRDEEVRGPKIEAFDRATAGDATAIAVDRWVYRFFYKVGKRDSTPTAAERQVIADLVNRSAEELGWTPAEVQAAVWAVAQTLATGKRLEDIASYDTALLARLDKVQEALGLPDADIALLRERFGVDDGARGRAARPDDVGARRAGEGAGGREAGGAGDVGPSARLLYQHRDYAGALAPGIAAAARGAPEGAPVRTVVRDVTAREEMPIASAARPEDIETTSAYGLAVRGAADRPIPAAGDDVRQRLNVELGYAPDQRHYDAVDLQARLVAREVGRRMRDAFFLQRYVQAGSRTVVPEERLPGIIARVNEVLGDLPAALLERRTETGVARTADDPLGLTPEQAMRVRVLLDHLEETGWAGNLPALGVQRTLPGGAPMVVPVPLRVATAADLAEHLTTTHWNLIQDALRDAYSGAQSGAFEVGPYATGMRLAWWLAKARQSPIVPRTPEPGQHPADVPFNRARGFLVDMVEGFAHHVLPYQERNPRMPTWVLGEYQMLRRRLVGMRAEVARRMQEVSAQLRLGGGVPQAAVVAFQQLAGRAGVPVVAVADLEALRRWLYDAEPVPPPRPGQPDAAVRRDLPRGTVDPARRGMTVAEIVANRDLVYRTLIRLNAHRIGGELVGALTRLMMDPPTLTKEDAGFLRMHLEAVMEAAKERGRVVLEAAAGRSGEDQVRKQLANGTQSGIELDAYDAWHRAVSPVNGRPMDLWADERTPGSVAALVKGRLGLTPVHETHLWAFEVVVRETHAHLVDRFIDNLIDRAYAIDARAAMRQISPDAPEPTLGEVAHFSVELRRAIKLIIEGDDILLLPGHVAPTPEELAGGHFTRDPQGRPLGPGHGGKPAAGITEPVRRAAWDLIARWGLLPDLRRERSGIRKGHGMAAGGDLYDAAVFDGRVDFARVLDEGVANRGELAGLRTEGGPVGRMGRDVFLSSELVADLQRLQQEHANVGDFIGNAIRRKAEDGNTFARAFAEATRSIKQHLVAGGPTLLPSIVAGGGALLVTGSIPVTLSVMGGLYAMTWLPPAPRYATNTWGALFMMHAGMGLVDTVRALANPSIVRGALGVTHETLRLAMPRFIENMGLYRAASAVTSRLLRGADDPDTIGIVTRDGRIYTVGDLQRAFEHGGLQGTLASFETLEAASRRVDIDAERDNPTLWSHVKRWFGHKAMQDNYRSAYESIDLFFRSVVAMRSLMDGIPMHEAINRSLLINFDYTNAAKIDRFVGSVTLFWMYQRRTMDLSAWALVHHPERMMGLARFMRDQDIVSGYADDQSENVPPWAQVRPALAYLPVSNDGNVTGLKLMFPEPPMSTALNLLLDLQNLDLAGFMSRANPLLQIPMDVALNEEKDTYSFFRRRSVGDPRYWEVPPGFVYWDHYACGGAFARYFRFTPVRRTDDPGSDIAPGNATHWYPAADRIREWNFFRTALPGTATGMSILDAMDRSSLGWGAANFGPGAVTDLLHDLAPGLEATPGEGILPEHADARLAVGEWGEILRLLGIGFAPITDPTVAREEPERVYLRKLEETAGALVDPFPTVERAPTVGGRLGVDPARPLGVRPDRPLGVETTTEPKE